MPKSSPFVSQRFGVIFSAMESSRVLNNLRSAIVPQLRAFVERPSMGLVRGWILTREVSRESKRVQLAASGMGLEILSPRVFRQLRSRKAGAETAYILGTGASAAKLTKPQLEEVSSQFSIGVNQWMLHPMIPDVYAYEVDPDARLLQSLNREDVRVARPFILFLRPKTLLDQTNASFVPEFLRPRTFVYGRANIWTRRRKNICSDVMANLNRIVNTDNFAVLPDNGASIVRMILLAILLNFKRIVLVGVDLNNVRYFWHEDPSLLRRLGFSNFGTAQTGSIHETMSNLSRPFPVDIFIAELAEGIGRRGISLEIESSESELAKYLAVKRW